MDKIYYLGTVPPFANGVYRLKVGIYAKFADGNWYTPAVTYKEALLVQDLAPDYKPEYRKADSDMWCEIAYRKFVEVFRQICRVLHVSLNSHCLFQLLTQKLQRKHVKQH